MELTLVRHTAVDVPKGTIYGQTDVDLATTFEVEAQRISHHLDGSRFNAIYCSPLSRCKRLAEFLYPNETVCYDERLKEINFGDWEGKNWDDISETETAKTWFKSWKTTKCPGGESNHDVQQRVLQCLDEIRDKHKNESVLIIAHGGPLKMILAHINHIPIEDQFSVQMTYGTITHIQV